MEPFYTVPKIVHKLLLLKSLCDVMEPDLKTLFQNQIFYCRTIFWAPVWCVLIFEDISFVTRMHSSRMRTIRCIGRLMGGNCLPGCVCLRGCLHRGCLPRVSALSWGICPGGVCPGGVSQGGSDWRCLPRKVFACLLGGVYTSPCRQNSWHMLVKTLPRTVKIATNYEPP